MIVEMLWFRNRSGFWCVRVAGQALRSTRTGLAMAMKDLAYPVAIAAWQWSDL